MTLKGAAQEIRDTVTMDQILGLYGYTPRHGFIVCPFHGDKDASLKIYKGTGGWHCFGCGKGGSVIDFVMEHEGCDFRTAVEAIDHALGLRLRLGPDDLALGFVIGAFVQENRLDGRGSLLGGSSLFGQVGGQRQGRDGFFQFQHVLVSHG